jgi:hypothetical protein
MVAVFSVNRSCLDMHSICTLYVHKTPRCDNEIDDIEVP